MTAALIKRGFRRITLVIAALTALAVLGGGISALIAVLSDPKAHCPATDFSVRLPQTPIQLAQKCQQSAALDKVIDEVLGARSTIEGPPATELDYQRAHAEATRRNKDGASDGLAVVVSASIFGLVIIATIEALSWIIRGFMRE